MLTGASECTLHLTEDTPSITLENGANDYDLRITFDEDLSVGTIVLPEKNLSIEGSDAGLNTIDAETPGPFAMLFSLEAGDRFMVHGEDGMRLFAVRESLKAASVDDFADRVGPNSLVLLTCEDESAAGGYLNRRVVIAEALD